jgi:predicted metal-dependent hydrolase
VTVDGRRGVVVTIPPATRRGWAHPDAAIQRFLVEREAWVRRHLDRVARARAELAARGGIADGASFRYLGELHRLRIVPAPARSRSGPDHGVMAPTVRRSIVSREGADHGDELVVRLASRDRRPPAAVLEAWLRARAGQAIDQAIAWHAPALGVQPARVTLRDPRSRWGSASRKGALSLSWRLILAPPEALETVVVHELAHLRVFGHGERFWALVASRRPDHAVWRRWLRRHATEIHGALDGLGESPETGAGHGQAAHEVD